MNPDKTVDQINRMKAELRGRSLAEKGSWNGLSPIVSALKGEVDPELRAAIAFGYIDACAKVMVPVTDRTSATRRAGFIQNLRDQLGEKLEPR